MGLKVYGMTLSTNTIRVLTALNEKGLEYELVDVDLRTDAHKQPSFLALNPFGQIPVLQDGDLVIFESRAINRYIATKYKETGPDLLRSGSALAESAVVETWLEVEAQQFCPPIFELVFEAVVKPVLGGQTDEAVVENAAGKLSKVLDVYEARLAKSKYLAGGEFTVADLNHFACMYYLMKSPKADLVTSRPHVLAWWQDIGARPAWKKTAEAIPL